LLDQCIHERRIFPEPEGPSTEFVSIIDSRLHCIGKFSAGSIFTGTPLVPVCEAELKSAFFPILDQGFFKIKQQQGSI